MRVGTSMDPVKKLYERLAAQATDKCYAWYKPGKYFRCSESGKCVTALWYRLYGYRPAPRGEVMEMYGVCGDLDHDLTRQLFEYADVPIHMVTQLPTGKQVEGLLLDSTLPVMHCGYIYDVRIKGRSDGEIDVALVGFNPGRVLLEIKGTGFYPYMWLQKAYDKDGILGLIERIKDKHPEWYAQVQVSMGLTGHDYCYLVVKDRSTGTIGFFKDDPKGEPDPDTRTGVLIPFNHDFFCITLQRFAYVLRKLEEDKVPKPEFLRGSKNCKQCDFFYRCHGAKDGKIVYPGPHIDMEVTDVAPHDERTMGGYDLDSDARYSE